MRAVKVSFGEKTIDEIFRHLDRSHLPGAAVGIAIAGMPVYRKGFGLASIEPPTALNPQTRMRVHSITKHFTCLAYLLLCEEGAAAIDDPIGKYLPALHPITHRATMRQLMTHTSGLRDACDIRWFFSGIERAVAAREVLALYRDIANVNFPPGQDWCYNNGGYHILGSVIEKVADEPLEEVFRQRIFEPAGMRDTLLRRLDTGLAPNSAAMYMATAAGNAFVETTLPGDLVGEGGVVSTAEDMLQWMRNMSRPVVGSPGTWALMRTSQRLSNGADTGYGLGLLLAPYRGWDVVSHAGGGLGSNSQMIRVPAADLDVIVLVNRSDVSAQDLAARVLDSCLGIGPESMPADGDPIDGLFRSQSSGRIIHLYGREGKQSIAIDGGEGTPGHVTADHELGPPAHSCWPFAIRWRGPGQPECIRYEFHGSMDELVAGPSEATVELDTIAGDYEAQGIDAGLTVGADTNAANLITRGRFGSRAYRAERMAPNVWRLNSLDGTGWHGTLTADPGSEVVILQTPESWRVSFRRS